VRRLASDLHGTGFQMRNCPSRHPEFRLVATFRTPLRGSKKPPTRLLVALEERSLPSPESELGAVAALMSEILEQIAS
jgi:hypothetical protein